MMGGKNSLNFLILLTNSTMEVLFSRLEGKRKPLEDVDLS